MAAPLRRSIGPNDGKSGLLGSIGARLMIEGAEAAAASRSSSTRCRRARSRRRCTGTRARTSTATCWRAAWARCSATRCVEAGPGDLVFKPRAQWHTFWNAGDEPARILEIIAPAGLRAVLRRS